MLSRAAMLETLLCLLAVLGLGATLVPDYRHAATIDYVATDFKTLYSSASLLAEHRDPYDMQALPGIFRRDSVVEPATWFSRSPVYPPVTLALVAPFTAFAMPGAAIAWFALSLAAYASALALVLAVARRAGLGWPWRMAILALGVANPMLAYALEVGNPSVLSAALAIDAWMILTVRPASAKHWAGPALLLAPALVLKPHLAFWIVLGLLLFAGATAQKAAAGATLIAAALAGTSALWLAVGGRCLATFRSYAALLASERAAGSMSFGMQSYGIKSSGIQSPGSHELLPLPAQITAAQSLFGPIDPTLRDVLCFGLLLGLAAVLLAAILTQHQSRTAAPTILSVSAVAAFGLIATYHRAHDSLVLLPLLLWVAMSLVRGARVPAAVLLAVLLLLWIPLPGSVFLLHQTALLLLCLVVILSFLARKEAKKGGMNGSLSMPGGQ